MLSISSRIPLAQIFLLTLTVGIASASWAQTEDEVLWQKLDITEDGWLDGKELDETLKEYDTDGDKEVTKAEFLAGRAKARDVGHASSVEADTQLFQKIDASENGYLSGSELDSDNARSFDANGDKRVTLEEFLAGRAKERGVRALVTAPATKTQPVTKPAVKPTPKTAGKPATQPTTATQPKEAMPAPIVMTKDKINGLFFMTRFWSGSGTLEKASWYFAPDGKYYRDLTTGFSSAELAAFDGEKGTYKVAGNLLSTTRSNGEKTESEIEPSTNAWYWNGGLFTSVTPFENATELVGSYEGGESSVYSGNVATISKTLNLQPNGTFSWGGLASFKTNGNTTTTRTASESTLAGKWSLSGYVLTLTTNDGQVTKGISFPYDNEKTEIKPDRFFFAGTMYKKQ